MSDLLWFVAHTRPRCEKKLAEYCGREAIIATLPCYNVAHKYRGKTVVFRKPLFPGYVFLQLAPQERGKVQQSEYTARLLEVVEQAIFSQQLEEILLALDAGLEIRLAPALGEGARVIIKYGPLRGIEGWVEKRFGMNVVLLRLDFIGKAAAIKLDASELELV